MDRVAPKDPFENLLGLRSPDSGAVPPTLAQWLALDVARFREVVSAARVSIIAPGDGTRRFVLLRSGGEPVNAKRYFDIAGAGLRDMLARLFGHGLDTVLCPLLPPSAFSRGPAYITQGLQACHALLGGEALSELYARCGIRARLYGGFREAGLAEPVLQLLESLERRLVEMTPTGDRLLLFGMSPVSAIDELIALSRSAGPHLDRAAIRRLSFPDGPDKADLAISYDQLRVSEVLPPLLDHGTDVYHLTYLPFELTDHDIRVILYDHLIVRPAARHDQTNYSEDDLEMLRWSREHRERVEGLGSATLRQLRRQ
jgi:hypothetical protein